MTTTKDDLRNWDIRTLERRLRKKEVSKKDYEKHLKGLPDVADKVAPPESDEDDDAGDTAGTNHVSDQGPGAGE
jgi:hypothetical protein